MNHTGKDLLTRIFVYEHISAGGLWLDKSFSIPFETLEPEGKAMLEAALADFALVDEVEIVTMIDSRSTIRTSPNVVRFNVDSEEKFSQYFSQGLARADFVFLIAPEKDGVLLELSQKIEQSGRKLISPNSEFVRLATSKFETNRKLKSVGIRVPKCDFVESLHANFVPAKFPCVVKPNDGCGSIDTVRVHSIEEWRDLPNYKNAVVEEWVDGIPGSVAVLCNSRVDLILPACRQYIRGAKQLEYAGGSFPVSAEFNERARRLAERVIDAMPKTCGYFGIDIVWGEDRCEDSVIEINPRLTTSYVGLRKATHHNLLSILLNSDPQAPSISWLQNEFEFEANGTIREFD